jgi:hypothetical protein
VSEFGQRIGARTPSASDLDQQPEEVIDYSDNVIPADEEEASLDGGGRRLKTNWVEHRGGSGSAAYSFGYDLPDQSSYSAGAGTGFVVHNKHATRVRPPYRRPSIPDSPRRHSSGWGAPEEDEPLYPIGPTRPSLADLQPRPWSAPRRRKPAYVVKIRRPVKQDPAWVYFRPPNPGRPAPSRGASGGGGWSAPAKPQRPVKVNYPEDNYGSDGSWDQDAGSNYPNSDASYAFAFDAGDHNRHEVADPWGNVRGSYSYIDPNGIRRTVHYSASSATGFKILKAEPSSQVSTVYREPRPRPRPQQQQPSAFVYHLHPDGGWKPWEASHSRTPQSGKPRRPQNSVSQSYHYQSQTFGRKGQDDPLQQTLLTPTAKRQRKPPTKSQKSDLEEIQPTVDQQYSDSDYETQDLAETRFDSQRNDVHSKGPEIRGYRGGYGDKNPLLVLSESTKSERTIGPEANIEDEDIMKSNGNKPEMENQSKGPISIGKMMSMRMSSSQKKSKGNSRSPMTNSNSRKHDSGPTMITNPGRLMHYPRSRNVDNNNSRQDIDN